MLFILKGDHSLKTSEKFLGVSRENKSEILEIKIEDSFLYDKDAYIEFCLGGCNCFTSPKLQVENGKVTYELLNTILKGGTIRLQVVFKGEDNWVWKSLIASTEVRSSLNITENIPEEQPDLIREIEEELIRLGIELTKKQDLIKFIYITNTSGILDVEELGLLLENKVNRLVFNNTIYYLSIIENEIRKYFSKNQSSKNNEIQVNSTTGEYEVISKIDPILEQHIENRNIHVSAEDRLFWDNKVSAITTPLSQDDNILILTNENIYNQGD